MCALHIGVERVLAHAKCFIQHVLYKLRGSVITVVVQPSADVGELHGLRLGSGGPFPPILPGERFHYHRCDLRHARRHLYATSHRLRAKAAQCQVGICVECRIIVIPTATAVTRISACLRGRQRGVIC